MSGRDGGPAYPGKRCESVQPSDKFSRSTAEITYGGLTVRQAYKMAALTGCKPQFQFIDSSKLIVSSTLELAKYCGQIADAMLAEDAEFTKETPDA